MWRVDVLPDTHSRLTHAPVPHSENVTVACVRLDPSQYRIDGRVLMLLDERDQGFPVSVQYETGV